MGTRIYKELSQLNKKTTQLKNGQRMWTLQMANKHKKRCSTSLAIREMQIKTIIRYYFTPIRMATVKMRDKC